MQAKPLATNLGEQANKIAVSVQSGDGDVLALWGMCRRYAMQQATRWLRAFESSGGVELDDLEQSAFIGLLKAVQTWKPESGAFSTWYTIQLKAVFVEAYGMRTKRTREDPLNKYHLSLDTPLDENEDGSFTIADILPDERAEAEFEDIEQRDFQQAVQAALAQLPDAQREAIIGEFWFGRKPDPKLRREALRALRHPRIRKPLVEFYR
jgi:RNA polymerase sigma factor (sigma-70 family)